MENASATIQKCPLDCIEPATTQNTVEESTDSEEQTQTDGHASKDKHSHKTQTNGKNTIYNNSSGSCLECLFSKYLQSVSMSLVFV